MVCQNCHTPAPTKHVKFQQNIGLLVLRQARSIEGHLCKRCVTEYFLSFTGVTLLLGWWGVISFFFTPIIVISNIINYLGTLTLPSSPQTSNSLSLPAFLISSAVAAMLTFLGALIWIPVFPVVLITVALAMGGGIFGARIYRRLNSSKSHLTLGQGGFMGVISGIVSSLIATALFASWSNSSQQSDVLKSAAGFVATIVMIAVVGGVFGAAFAKTSDYQKGAI